MVRNRLESTLFLEHLLSSIGKPGDVKLISLEQSVTSYSNTIIDSYKLDCIYWSGMIGPNCVFFLFK